MLLRLIVYGFLLSLFSLPVFAMEEDESDDESFHLSQLSQYSETTRSQADEAFFLMEEGKAEEALDPLKYAADKRVRPSMGSYAFYLLSENNLSQSKTPLDDMKRSANFLLMSAYRGWEEALEFIEQLNPIVRQLTGTPETLQELVQIKRTNGKSIQELWKDLRPKTLKVWLKGEESFDPLLQELKDLTEIALLSEISDSVISAFENKVAAHFMELYPGSEAHPLTPFVPIAFDAHAQKKGIKTSVLAPYGPPLEEELQKWLDTKNKLLYAYDLSVRRFNKVSPQKFLKKEKETKTVKLKKSLLNPIKSVHPAFKATNASLAAMAAGPVYQGLRHREEKSKKKEERRGKQYHVSEQHDFFLIPIYKRLSELFVQKKTSRPNWLIELTHMDKPYEDLLEWMSTQKDFKKGGHVKWPNTSLEGLSRIQEQKKVTKKDKKYNQDVKQFIDSGKIKKSLLYRIVLLSIYQKRVLDDVLEEEPDEHQEEPDSRKRKAKKEKKDRKKEKRED